MKTRKTLQYKIVKPNNRKKLSLNTTVREYRKCINFYLHQLAKGKEFNKIYYQAKENYNLPTALIQTARDIAKEQYKSYKNNENNPHFPHFNSFTPIRMDKRAISFKKENNHFKWWVNILTINGRVKVPITSCKKYLERLNEGFKSVQVIFKNNSFYLNVIFEEERQIPKEKDFEHFVGVDLGIDNIATVVVQNREGKILESKFFSGEMLMEKRRRFAKLRKELGEEKKWKEIIRKTKGKERNYIKDQNHKVSTEIVRIAEKYPNCCVIMEKLKGIRDETKYSKESSKEFHSWAFSELQKFIEYKAHYKSIAVRKVNPAYTSQVCRNCLGKVERSSQSKVVCQTCKKEYNADWLGAVNITRRLFGYMSDNLGCSGSSPRQGNINQKGVIAPSFGESKGLMTQLSVS